MRVMSRRQRGETEDVRVIRNFISGDIPVCDEGEVGVVDGVVVGHLGLTTVGVLAVCEELVDGIEGELSEPVLEDATPQSFRRVGVSLQV